jgi:uncharacterized membrane protein
MGEVLEDCKMEFDLCFLLLHVTVNSCMAFIFGMSYIKWSITENI